MATFKFILPIIIGFIIDFLLGDPRNMPHPVRLIGKLISFLEKKIRKDSFDRRKKPITEEEKKSEELVQGVFLVITVLIVSIGIPAAILLLAYRINSWLGIVVESIMCYYLIAARSLETESNFVGEALIAEDIPRAKKELSMIVSRDVKPLDDEGIIKATVETIAENTSDGVTNPLFYMCFGGAIMAVLYKAINTLDSMIGYKNQKYINFGRLAAKLDDIAGFIPSRITGIFMVLAAYIMKYDGKYAFKMWKRDRKKTDSPNAGQTEAAMAGALDIQLGGPGYYGGQLVNKATLGDPEKSISERDITSANRIMYCTSIIMVVFVCIVRAILFNIF